MHQFFSALVRFTELAPTTSGFYRMAFGALTLLLWLGIRGKIRLPALRHMPILLVIAFSFTADLWFWHQSIIRIGPGLSTILANLQVFVMAVVGIMVYREKLDLRFAVGLLLAFGGLWWVLAPEWTGFSADYKVGIWLGIATAVAYSAYILSLRRFQERHDLQDARLILLWSSVCVAAMLAVIGVAEQVDFRIQTLPDFSAMLAYGVLCQVLGWVLIASSHGPPAYFHGRLVASVATGIVVCLGRIVFWQTHNRVRMDRHYRGPVGDLSGVNPKTFSSLRRHLNAGGVQP